MFSLLFAGKIEKELKAMVDSTPGLEVRYQDGAAITISQIVKIQRNTVVILGFSRKLKSSDLRITLLANGAFFDTKVRGIGLDQVGRTIYYCRMPEKIQKPKARFQRYRVYPHGDVKFLLSTNHGQKSLSLPIWDVTDLGMVLVNDSEVAINPATKLFQSLVAIGPMDPQLADLQVALVQMRVVNQTRLPLLTCIYLQPPRALTSMLQTAKGVVPKPSGPRGPA